MYNISLIFTALHWTVMWSLFSVQESLDNKLLSEIQSSWTAFTSNFCSKYHGVDYLTVASNGRAIREIGRDGQHNFFYRCEYVEGTLNGRNYLYGFSNDYAFVLEAHKKSDWKLVAMALGNSQSNKNLKSEIQDYLLSKVMHRKFDSGMISVARGVPLDVLDLHDKRWGVKLSKETISGKPCVRIFVEPKLPDLECPDTGILFPLSTIKSGELVLDCENSYLPISGKFQLERTTPNHLVWEERFSWSYDQSVDGVVLLNRFVMQEYYGKADRTFPDQPSYEYQGQNFQYYPTVDASKFLVSNYGFAEPKTEAKNTSWFVPVLLLTAILLGLVGIYLKSNRK